MAVALVVGVASWSSRAEASGRSGSGVDEFFLAMGFLTGGVGGLGGSATLVGNAVTFGDRSSRGWAIASLVFGPLAVTGGALLVGVDPDSPGPFTAVGTTCMVVGAADIGLGIAKLAMPDRTPASERETTWIPVPLLGVGKDGHVIGGVGLQVLHW